MINTACGMGVNEMKNTPEKIINNVLEEVLYSIEQQNPQNLKLLFSKTAIENSNSIDKDIEYLFNFFDGDINNIEDTGAFSEDEVNNGNVVKRIEDWFYIDTTKNRYLIFMVYYSQHDTNPNMEGLYTLRIIEAVNEDTEFFNRYTDDLEIAGIYNPTKQ